MVNTARAKRGGREVVCSTFLFLNDDEPGEIVFTAGGREVRAQFLFRPEMSPPKHPKIRYESQADGTKLTFHGWNAPLAYSAIIPNVLADDEDSTLAFSICNNYLDGTNMLHIQFYVEAKNA